jgi:acyl transferase domain-containing protein/thioesterase domain-containing protein
MDPTAIAIVGMAGRFPGARNLREFWGNLHDGVESIRDLTDAELLAAGATPEELASPDYVKRASVLDDLSMFDASFFGLSPRDASIMDPQHRQFLECSWEALEDAGHPPIGFDGSIGVFAGSGMNSYLIHNLLGNRRLVESTGLFQLKQTGNDKDVLTTRVSYQLDLRGPSINVQTACSTSLVAVHLACQSLLNHECDMALAGGVTIEIPHGRGYVYREGEILSRDGRCRAFDAGSSGTVFGSGLGLVVLRRLEDALADHDNIRAILLGSAINNDGARKVGYLAPSVDGQAEVIAEALEFAGVGADDISYVETHGTGTVVGDPIEVRALTQAFRRSTARSGYCAIGSLKPSIGHLDAAAGVAGLIKTVLALQHGKIPASLNYQEANPHIEFNDSPFFVNSRLAEWPAEASPRRAGVTSLGIGGTNAHVVLEEAPRLAPPLESKPYQLLTVSAKTEEACERGFANLAAHLQEHPEVRLADAACTCQLGRQAFLYRRAHVVQDTRESVLTLAHQEPKHFASGLAPKSAPPVAFMFSGQGAQYVNMGREIYEHETVFRDTLDLCAQYLQQPLGIDLRKALFPVDAEKESAAEKLNQTWLTQPALFAIEYSLAKWWMSLGVEPSAMVGHSIGEYVAACLAGVFTLEEALAVTAFRGQLMFSQPSGAMLAVPLAPTEVPLNGSISLAAVNNPRQCVVSGPHDEIAALEKSLEKQSVDCRRLHTSHAFHSAMMDPILGAFEERLRGLTLRTPRIPFLSNVSGTWIESKEATDPAYWARHLRQAVRFSDCISVLGADPSRVLLEVGPGNTLASLARQQTGRATTVFQSLPHPRENDPALRFALHTLAQIWVAGVQVDWKKLHEADSTQRVSLPAYSWDHRRFWIEPDAVHAAPAPLPASAPAPNDETDQWFYRRGWQAAAANPLSDGAAVSWVIFNDSLGLGDRIAKTLRANGNEVALVAAGSGYRQSKSGEYTIRPGVRADYDALVADLFKGGSAPKKILHLWPVEQKKADTPLDKTLERSFFSPLYLAQALAHQDIADVEIALVSSRMQQVLDEPVGDPARAVLLGPARVIPKELPGIACRSIDVDLENGNAKECAAQILSEISAAPENAAVAYRGSQRYVETLDRLTLSDAPLQSRLERGGVYLVTGGLGGLGLVVAEHLAREFGARLILVSRSAVPPQEQWESALSGSHETEASKQTIRKLLEIRSCAGGLLVAQGDVTDLDAMRGIVAAGRKQYGKIDGVIHAAGVLEDAPLMLKTATSASRVLDPKVRGTLVLEEVFRGTPLRCFVLFSSISSLFPPAGQVDYAAANAFLDAFALSRGEPVIAIDWGAWREVGMSARSSSPHPLLQRRLLDTPRESVYSSHFSPQAHWLLAEHKLKTGKALLPGTGYLEMAAAAFTHSQAGGGIQFENVYFLAPMLAGPNDSREVRFQLRREEADGKAKPTFHFSVIAHAGEWGEYSSGIVAPCPAQADSSPNRAAIMARCQGREIVFDEQFRTKQEAYFDFGPRWRCLKKLKLGEREGLAELELDRNFAGECSTLRMHPALLDLATGCALYLIDGYETSTALYFPVSYKRARFYGSLPSKLFSHIRSRGENQLRGEVQSFDITLFDEQERVLAEIEGFAMRRMDDPTAAVGDKARNRPASLSAAAQALNERESAGILPRDGARALTRLLLARTPASVVATAQTLEELLPRRPAIVQPTIRVAKPTEELEGAIAGWWRELLGVEGIGLDDDFFSLGGHSLIGVRLFAKIKKAYQVDLELALLFEARTVRQLADTIRKARQPESSKPKTWPSLVPIQPNGARVPLFCIHAIGGDVLFYEQLARALGPDQPFYAFQSPFVSQPIAETSLEEMAAVYVRDLQNFLPSGPFLLGGASFGGLVAFEMARQLTAQGRRPESLVLFDTVVPGSEQRLSTTGKVSRLWRRFSNEGAQYLARKAGEKSHYWRSKLYRRFQALESACYQMTRRDLPPSLRYFQVEEAHWRALGRYTFKPFPGKITLMRAVDRGPEALGKLEDPSLGWMPLAESGVEIHDVPTAHMSMLFEPYVKEFAKQLNAVLAP